MFLPYYISLTLQDGVARCKKVRFNWTENLIWFFISSFNPIKRFLLMFYELITGRENDP